jgi:thiol-disulfide isomerase/thioredoxin
MARKLLIYLSMLIGIGFLLFWIFVSRPYYIAHYGIPVVIITLIAGTSIIIVNLIGNKNFLPESLNKWIGIYYGLLVIIGSIFYIIFTYPFISNSSRYNNPYVISQNEYGILFDEEEIKKEIISWIGKKLPECEFNLINEGNKNRLHNFTGKIILLNFWATWCSPCVAELPALDTLYLRYKEQGLIVIALSFEGRDTIREFLKYYPNNLITGYYKNEVPLIPYRALPQIPQTFIIDRNGILREWWVGGRKYQEFENIVKQYL